MKYISYLDKPYSPLIILSQRIQEKQKCIKSSVLKDFLSEGGDVAGAIYRQTAEFPKITDKLRLL